MGLLLQVKVHAANIQDRDGAKLLLPDAKKKLPRLVIIWADHSYKGGWGPKRQLRRLDEWVWEELWCILEVVERIKDQSGEVVKGFHPLPKRWVVERTFAWLYRYRSTAGSPKTTSSPLRPLRLSSISLLLTSFFVGSRRLVS